MNWQWHQEHKMPEGASDAERIEWHLQHREHCVCRAFPKGLLAKLNEEQTRLVACQVEPRHCP